MHLTSRKVADSELLLSQWYVSVQMRRVTLSAHSQEENAGQDLLTLRIWHTAPTQTFAPRVQCGQRAG
jgi:hypothetical protein